MNVPVVSTTEGRARPDVRAVDRLVRCPATSVVAASQILVTGSGFLSEGARSARPRAGALKEEIVDRGRDDVDLRTRGDERLDGLGVAVFVALTPRAADGRPRLVLSTLNMIPRRRPGPSARRGRRSRGQAGLGEPPMAGCNSSPRCGRGCGDATDPGSRSRLAAAQAASARRARRRSR